ncbi:MAG: 5-(carboxyamino)imidazole ribonucleotide synthase, partial [Propionibacteriales bacterium]|nr:5-(carboxyamino)imidazole ribonucleotide synthase [Propionibacteriales bacterium]
MSSPHLAVIGGGQLARMMQQAAIGLGIRIRLLAEGDDASAAQVIADKIVGDYTDLDILREVVADCPVVTFDHEHVPPAHLQTLEAEGHACRPGPAALVYAQDKGLMRTKLATLGAPQPDFSLFDPVVDPNGVQNFADRVGGYPFVLKTTRGGYDGKGVWFIYKESDAAAALASGRILLAEAKVPFVRELSALVARSASGEVAAYPIAESVQKDGMCHEVVSPAPDLDPALAKEAQQLAINIAEQLGVTGILAVELFETPDRRIVVNELAMRPHNTGHWSIDGAVTSQFENHLRAVLGMPLGSTSPHRSWAVMVNILGGVVDDLESRRALVMAQDCEVKIHLYGKNVKPGRKVGHVTVCGDDFD